MFHLIAAFSNWVKLFNVQQFLAFSTVRKSVISAKKREITTKERRLNKVKRNKKERSLLRQKRRERDLKNHLKGP